MLKVLKKLFDNEYKELRDKFDDLKARYSLLDDDLYNRNLAYNKSLSVLLK